MIEPGTALYTASDLERARVATIEEAAEVGYQYAESALNGEEIAAAIRALLQRVG